MKKIAWSLMLMSVVAGSAICAESTAKTMEKKVGQVVKSVQEGCKTEMSTFCKDVTPGEGRVLACLYAFEDKLSGQCEYALYDAATQLQQAVVKLSHVANECSEDIDKYCPDVQPGEGRILDCLKKNEKKVAAKCSKALKDTGVTK